MWIRSIIMRESSNNSLKKTTQSVPASLANRLKFNWAAFLFPPIWLFGHKFWVWGLGYAVTMIVSTGVEIRIRLLINLLQIGLGIFLGTKGNSMLWQSGRYRSIEELYRREKTWVYFALVSFLVSFGLVLIARL